MRCGGILGAVVLHLLVSNTLAEPSAKPETPPRQIEDFTLKDPSGKSYSLDDLKESRLVVVAFLGVECPLVKLYSSRLQQLSAEYREREVAFLGIDSNRQDSLAELAAYAKLHHIEFPLLKDPGNRVADLFGATRMSEVFVLDQERVVRFQGRIDDQYGPGYARPKPQREDLRQALDELLSGNKVSEPVTAAIGCLIGRTRIPDAKSPVTYASHIAGILNKRCVTCHRPDQIAPFSLTDYEEVAGWADMIAEVVAADRMPPWHADPKYGEFVGDRRLSAEEKQLIRSWSAAGAPEGDRSELPEPTQYLESGWKLAREPDFVIATRDTPFSVQSEGTLDYEYFIVDPEFKEDKWVIAAEVLPGNHAVVHHATVFAWKGSVEDALRDGTTEGYLAIFVPGMLPTAYPPGMAKRILAGSKLVFQVHYVPNGSAQLDISKLGLLFADDDDVEHEIITGNVKNRTFTIPAGVPDHRVEANSIHAPRNSKLLSLMPHMHARGATFQFEAVFPNGTTETLLSVPKYDFNWQTSYQLVKPRALPRGTYLHCVAHFDNSVQNLANPDPTREVGYGIQARDEMMVGYFDVAVRRDRRLEKHPPNAKPPFKQASVRRTN
jgi:peroxiredoxin